MPQIGLMFWLLFILTFGRYRGPVVDYPPRPIAPAVCQSQNAQNDFRCWIRGG